MKNKDHDLLRTLLPDFAGTNIYIPKRPQIDWSQVAQRWQAGITQADLARELGVTRRTVNKRLRVYRRRP